MENPNNSRPEKKAEGRTAHSNFRKGLTDYHDGEKDLTNYLGNDAYPEGQNLKDPDNVEDNKRLSGKVAEGNDFIDDDLEETASEEDKYQEDQLANYKSEFE